MRFLTIAVMALAAIPGAAVHAAVPVHAYEFDSDASDSVGGADGTLSGGAYVAAGRLELDGADDFVGFGSYLVPTSGA